MVWTYSGDPSSSDKDAVRFLIGDTNTDDQLVADEEIDWLLTQELDTNSAAARACDTIEASFSRLADKSVGDLHLSLSQKAIAYRALAISIRARSAVTSPYCGGITKDPIFEDDLMNADQRSET